MKKVVTPQIISGSLAITTASLISINIKNPIEFDWIDKPDNDAWTSALKDLQFYNALENGILTNIGQLVSDLHIDPGIANMICNAMKKGLGNSS